MPRHSPIQLFSDHDWHDLLETQKSQMATEIDAIEPNRLLNTSPDDLCEYFFEKYKLDVPNLHEEHIHSDQQETEIDVSRDPNRAFFERDRPLKATAVEITIPFSGHYYMFQVRPTTTSMPLPHAAVRPDSLLLTFEGTDLNAEQVRADIDCCVSKIRVHLDRLRVDAVGFNDQLRDLARGQIERRREKLLGDQNLVAALGFPLKQRNDAPTTVTAPEVRRRITPLMPKAATSPFRPEHVLSADDYEHILSVISNMVHVMERSPSAFENMGEEGLRTHFLVQLNGHYEGQATGETFNYEGKTDILIRVKDRNIFIAECKFWNGPKGLTKTVDQLLGYASWRDTKVAIIIFNRQKNFSHVLRALPESLRAHPNFKRELSPSSETSFRYVFSHRDDPNREMTLTALAFDVPQKV